MAMKCPACGGHLAYSVELNQLKCPYCTSTFEIEDYNEKNTAIAEKDSETLSVNRFVCRNCGAELSSTDSPDEQLVQYCAYCGSESLMMGKADATEIPETIIPFKITKDRAKEKYAEEVKKMFFVPKEFKNRSQRLQMLTFCYMLLTQLKRMTKIRNFLKNSGEFTFRTGAQKLSLKTAP